MTRVVIDAETWAHLRDENGLLELCDPSGRVLGHFQPVVRVGIVRNGKICSPYTDEEIEAGTATAKGGATSRVLEGTRSRMTYTVVWLPEALMELATVWNDADDRGEVAAASDEIDRQLATGPRLVGESRAGDLRVLFSGPLAIDYQIVEDDRMVTVLAVWYSRYNHFAGLESLLPDKIPHHPPAFGKPSADRAAVGSS